MSSFDVSGGSLPSVALATFALPDPTFDRVKEGRKAFLDASFSGSGTAFCGSCHHDLRKDGLGWQLSKYFDDGEGFSNDDPPTAWLDLKGVMVTQDLRSLADNPGYHWRGEEPDFDVFNAAFEGLLKGVSQPPASFELLEEYVFSAVYPPNPLQPLNRVFSAQALRGADVFANVDSDQIGPCGACHPLPTGTNASITARLLNQDPSPDTVKTPQLRGMWTKFTDVANVSDVGPGDEGTEWPSTGFGFMHDGVMDTLRQFSDAIFLSTLSL